MNIINKALEWMDGLTTMTLATSGEDGQPHAAAVYFAADSLANLYFLSSKKTIHAMHLLRNPCVAATIHDENQTWLNLRGIQLHGHAKPILDKEVPNAFAIYSKKFPFLLKALATGGDLAAAFSQTTWWRLSPSWIRLIDNSKGFGFKEEIVLSQNINIEKQTFC